MPILTLITFLLVLSVLILVHEFGHFVMARLFGVGVEEFALGLPFTRPLWQKKLKDGLRLSLYPVLFGGFVKLLGEDDAEVQKSKI
jgi:regulator of sigma E protease